MSSEFGKLMPITFDSRTSFKYPFDGKLSFEICQQAYNDDSWTYKMTITGPSRDVKIEGKLTPCKRRLQEGPWTIVRQCTMFEGQDNDKEEKGCQGEQSASSSDNKCEEPEVPDTQPLDTELDGDSFTAG